MRLRAVSRWLSRQFISVAMHVSPCEREEWAQAMSREVDAIPSEREALRWALGCLQAVCLERLKSMKPTTWWLVRWGIALWIALLAIDTLAYAGITLTYKLQAWRAIPILGLLKEHYLWNVPLLEVTPLWEPLLTLVALLFAVRFSRPESGYAQSLSLAFQKSHYAWIWPIAGLAITMLICVTLWHDRQTPAPR